MGLGEHAIREQKDAEKKRVITANTANLRNLTNSIKEFTEILKTNNKYTKYTLIATCVGIVISSVFNFWK